MRRDRHEAERDRDREHAHDDREHRRHQRAERHHQHDEGERQRLRLAPLGVLGADGPDVVIERREARQLHLEAVGARRLRQRAPDLVP